MCTVRGTKPLITAINLLYSRNKMKKTNLLASLVAISALFFNTFSFAAEETQQDANGVILTGYDAVSYFTKNAAVKGYAGISASHDGAIYHFSSEENRDLFKANPSKYAPQYGGFCAYGAAISRKFPIDPNVFAIVDGKLYVNNSAAVSETWTEERDDYIKEANKNWGKIKAVPAADL